tara:strand:+ start:67 stop:486 length:420 start_codon:yes stop_codon:yes gene_type:complete
MIKDINEIKKHLKNCVEIELPYPFNKEVYIKYITVKGPEELFYLGGKFIRLLNDKIVLSNNGNTWTVPINLKNKQGEIIYKTRFFVEKDFNKEKDTDDNLELKSIIKTQQDIIEKLSKSLKLKSDENNKMKNILQRIKR